MSKPLDGEQPGGMMSETPARHRFAPLTFYDARGENPTQTDWCGHLDGADVCARLANAHVERAYRFVDGPWHGQEAMYPRAATPQHCMPWGESGSAGSTWAAADAWPGEPRYVPDGCDGDVVLMVWRHATADEIAQALVDRDERYADKHGGSA